MKLQKGSPDLFDDIWDFFTSVKLTVVVFLLLAATSIIGTLIPQNEDPAQYYRAFGEFYYRIFHVLDIFDMYHAWWLQFLLLLLTVNVIVCSVDRLSATQKIIFVKTPRFSASRFRRLSQKEEFSTSRSPQALEEMFRPVISKMFSYGAVEETAKGYCIFGEKGRLTRLGVYAVHLSVILLLLGGLIGSIFGFDGFVNIPEGETVNSIRIRNPDRALPLNFAVRCDKFSVSFYDTGMPREYRSNLTIIEGGRPVLQKGIIVNDPLRYKGINFFQSSYGPLAPEEVTLNFESIKTGKNYTETVTVGRQIDMPENLGKFVIRDFARDYNFRGQNIGEVFLGVLVRTGKDPADVVLPVRFDTFDKMRGDTVVITISKYTPRYFTGLQVTKDPGVWVVYSGFILLIAGCIITFFMSHQSLCVELVQSGNNCRVTVSGYSNKNKMGMQQKVARVSKKLQALIENTP